MFNFRKAPLAVHGANISGSATLDLLRRFDPMAGFDWHSLASIARHAQEVSLPAHRVLVQPPRRLRGIWYLCSGVVRDQLTGMRLQAGSARCRAPIYPSCQSLCTLTDVRLLFFAEHCTPMLQAEAGRLLPASGADVLAGSEFAASQWLETFAASPMLRLLYLRRGAQGWQRWLRELESIAVAPGVPLIVPGGEAKYFYVVQQGIARVTARPVGVTMTKVLAEVRPGGFFGEDALLSGQPRNAAVAMPHGGQVLRGSAVQLAALVSDLWWGLARKPGSWQADNRLLRLRDGTATSTLRGLLSSLPAHGRYGLPVDSAMAVQDLLLLLLVHRGYSVVLREDSDAVETLCQPPPVDVESRNCMQTL